MELTSPHVLKMDIKKRFRKNFVGGVTFMGECGIILFMEDIPCSDCVNDCLPTNDVNE